MLRPSTLLTLLILALTASALVPVLAEKRIELAWHDSGYDLAAGYRYSIGLQSPCVWTHQCALAAVSAGPLRIELRGGHLKIVANDETLFDEDLGETAVTVYITVSCDGSGSIEVEGYGNVGGFSIDRSYRIMVYTETVSVWPQSATSRVTISRQALNCWVTNPSLTPIGENPAQQVHYNPVLAALGGAATVAVVVIIVAFGVVLLLVVLGRLGGVKRLAKRAWG